MQLQRGYTRASDYFFDSDDDVPLPKPHPVVSAPLLGGTSLIVPPPQHRRGSAASAPMVTCTAKAIAADHRRSTDVAAPVANGNHLQQYQQLAPQTFRPPVHATVHELAAPPPPAVSAQPKPSKGCNKIPPTLKPLIEGTPWPLPEISNGYGDVGDHAPWRQIAVRQHGGKPWPMWGRGVTDLRPDARCCMVASRLLQHAVHTAIEFIRKTPCEHKIGMCRCPFARFVYYQEEDSRWSPWLLVLLASTTTR